MSLHTNQHRIVVLGAGYTGMMCAIRAARRTRRDGAKVTPRNPAARLTQRPRKPPPATRQNPAEVATPDPPQGTRVQFRQGWANRNDPDARPRRGDTAGGERVLEVD